MSQINQSSGFQIFFFFECLYMSLFKHFYSQRMFQRRQSLRIDNVFRTYFGYMVLPLALIGAVLVSLFIITVYKVIFYPYFSVYVETT